MMPGLDGVEVLKEIRKTSMIPVIMLTAKGETIDKVLALEIGADDYIVKPFETKELLARLKAVLRRVGAEEADDGAMNFENLYLNKSTYEMKVNGNPIDVPPKEFELLTFLCSHPNKHIPRFEAAMQMELSYCLPDMGCCLSVLLPQPKCCHFLLPLQFATSLVLIPQ